MFPSLKDCKNIKTSFRFTFTIIYNLNKNYKIDLAIESEMLIYKLDIKS